MWVYRVCSRGFRGAGGAGTACSVSSVCGVVLATVGVGGEGWRGRYRRVEGDATAEDRRGKADPRIKGF
jgi:hypothetical protein